MITNEYHKRRFLTVFCRNLWSHVKLNGAKTAAKFRNSPFVHCPRVRGNGFRHSSCVKKVSFERKGNSFLFHNGAHPLRATHEYPIIPKTERTKRKWFAQPTHFSLSLSLSPLFVCTRMYTRLRDEGVSVYYARTRGRSSLSRSIWPIRIPCTLLATMRSTWHFRPDEESVESLCGARLVPPRLRLTRQQLRSIGSEKNYLF